MVVKQEVYENALDVLFHPIRYKDMSIYLAQCKLDAGSVPYSWYAYEVQLHVERQGVDITRGSTSCKSIYGTVVSPVKICFPIHLSEGEWTSALHEEINLCSILDDLVGV